VEATEHDQTNSSTPHVFGWIAGAAIVALGLRLVYVLAFRQDVPLGGDDAVYHEQALLLADGHPWISPTFRATGEIAPQADHPPFLVAYLGLVAMLGLRSLATHLVAVALLGVGTVVVTGLLARRLAGDRAGALAAWIAAVAPTLWAWDGRTLAEGPATFLATATVLAAMWARDRTTPTRVAVVTATGTLAGLARAELLLLVPLLVVPLVWRAGVRAERRPVPRVLGLLFPSALVVLVLLGPWAAWNTARFDRPVLVSNGLGRTMASGDCDAGFDGPLVGYWSLDCLGPVLAAHPGLDEAAYDGHYRADAIRYLRAHAGEVPRVLAIRWARTVYLYRPTQQLELDQVAEGKEAEVAGAGLAFTYVGGAAAIAGAVVLRRRGAVWWPLLTPVVCVLASTAIAFGSVRYRAPAEGVLVVLAAVAVDAAIGRWAPRLRLPTAIAATLAVVAGTALLGAALGAAHRM